MRRVLVLACCALVLLATSASGPSAQAGGPLQVAQTSSDQYEPRRHLRTRRPASLSPEEAEALYRELAGSLSAGYAAGGHPVAEAYPRWRRYNSAPYLSSTHGNLYLNNYVNETAQAYGGFETAGTLPVGSVIAKDSFFVARDGEVRPGPLFVMEKMPKGFNYVSGDWRYIQIRPDGQVFGETRGRDSSRVDYCIACHLAAERHDHLFFVPAPYRVEP